MSTKSDAFDELESAPYMANLDDHRAAEAHSRAWRWLELLEKEGKLRSIDIMRIKNFADAVYDLGVHNGASNPYA